MRLRRLAVALTVPALLSAVLASCALLKPAAAPEAAQVPTWSRDEMDFFLHGSMGTEVVPETVNRALIKTYPDLFPTADLSHLGAIPDPAFGWPVGFSRARPPHLAGLSSIGINCASCHVGEVESGGTRVRVLGMTSHFNVEGFFNSLLGATFLSRDPGKMKRLIAAYLDESQPEPDHAKRDARAAALGVQWTRQDAAIAAAMAADPEGAKGAGPGGLQALSASDLQVDAAHLADTCVAMLKLFHNMRAALHVPDQPPEKLPPLSGPGRNDAFGLLSASLLGVPQPYAPVKYGLVWNVEHRHWVHWDGNTQSPLGRNMLAALGLGAPMIGHQAQLDVSLVKRHTAISEKIAAPRYPWAIDSAAAQRGAALYQANCATCHNGAEDDRRLFALDAIGTDPLRAQLVTPAQADRFNQLLASVRGPGYDPPAAPAVRSTQKYWSPSLAGVWARSPYLHNGSVRTMVELLTSPAKRSATFHRGTCSFDEAAMGYKDEGAYLFDTHTPGNANSGHDYGTSLTPEQRRDLIEYLKTF